MRRSKQEPVRETDSHPCAIQGCGGAGEYKAPRSRLNLHDYQWLCLPHVQEFNKGWDYFDGMDAAQIEAFMQDALTGHRPTWEREAVLGAGAPDGTARMEDEIRRFMGWKAKAKPASGPERVSAKERKALGTLGLEERCDAATLKRHYRALVKKHHPDLHPGNAKNEEFFKEIVAAHSYLVKLYEKGAM